MPVLCGGVGLMGEGEEANVTHSQLLRTLSLFGREGNVDRGRLIQGATMSEDGVPVGAAIEMLRWWLVGARGRRHG
jgi:hypothetical protein